MPRESRFIDLVDRTRSGQKLSKRDSLGEAPNQIPFLALLSFTTEFVLPTVFGEAKCLRTLTAQEIMSCLDMPATVTKTWNDDTRRAVARALTAPVKVADALGNHICRFVLLMAKTTNGATSKRTSPLYEMRPSKRVHDSDGDFNRTATVVQSSSWAYQSRVRFATFSLGTYELDSTVVKKGAKNDDAEVPTHLWDFRIVFLLGVDPLLPTQLKAAGTLRKVILRRWKHNVLLSWGEWWRATYSALRRHQGGSLDLIWNRGVRACNHATQATFWGWPAGSGIFFWRWPNEFLLDVCFGVAPLWTRQFEGTISRQGNLGDLDMRKRIAEKRNDVRRKGYITKGSCLATMNYFAAPKGDSDLRMVYDGTKSGLNSCLFAPWFPLPDADALVNILDDGNLHGQ
ncbi:hypothetical protein ACA910_006152 [Epithemia clementina (nom. ined.)]